MKDLLHLIFLALVMSPSITNPATSLVVIQNSIDPVTANITNRRILHQPLYPIDMIPPSTTAEPRPDSPESDRPFFPQVAPSTPDPDQQNTPISPTNFIIPVLPTNSPVTQPIKKIVTAVSVSIATLLMLLALAFFLYRYRMGYMAESVKLVGDNSERFPPATSNILYLGTIEPSNRMALDLNRSPYRRLNRVNGEEGNCSSPELQPLPPLTELTRRFSPYDMSSDEETQFYSPQESIVGNSKSSCYAVTKQSLAKPTTPTATRGIICTSNCTSPPSASPGTTISINSTDRRLANTLPPSLLPSPPPLPPLPRLQQTQVQCVRPQTLSPKAKFPSPPSQQKILVLPSWVKCSPPLEEKCSGMPPMPPPPLPLPSVQRKIIHSETSILPMPVQPSSRSQSQKPTPMEASPDETLISDVEANHGGSSLESLKRIDNKDSTKPRLKPLHWDKLRTRSDHAMVWDQLKSSNFQLNEDMIETLFVSTSTIPVKKGVTRRSVLPPVDTGNKVLDPKKSQNIAILLRALNVTQEEVSEALLDGNPEGLEAELLETLVKIAPTKEEELKLKNYDGDISKLGSAERFLKAVLDIPFAFNRVDAMLYRANFDIEVKYLRKSFETLEVACEELKNSRLFLKLLEAVLHTGNRMNVGTNRGEAKAFRLDTLLKLVDVKGTDGKTTLLHFVVQELIRSEALGPDIPNQMQPKEKDDEFTKQGLRVVAMLSTELGNVRKAAGLDSDVLSSYLSKLETGLEKIKLTLKLEKSGTQEGKFFESMKLFLKKSEDEIARIKAEEKTVLSHLKEITEYFHGYTAKEEAHPFRIFMVVRDFLLVLDQVCKDVRKIHDRTRSVRSFRISASATSLPVFNRFNRRQDETSSDEDSSSL